MKTTSLRFALIFMCLPSLLPASGYKPVPTGDDEETGSSSAIPRAKSAPSSKSVIITTRRSDDGKEIMFFENGKFFATASPKKHDKTIFDYLTPENWRNTRRKYDHSGIGIKWATLTSRRKALHFTLDSYMALSGLLESLKLIPDLTPYKYLLANHHSYTVENITDSYKKFIDAFPDEALDRKVAELEGRAVPTVSACDEGSEAPEEAAAAASASSAPQPAAAGASSAAGT